MLAPQSWQMYFRNQSMKSRETDWVQSGREPLCYLCTFSINLKSFHIIHIVHLKYCNKNTTTPNCKLTLKDLNIISGKDCWSQG